MRQTTKSFSAGEDGFTLIELLAVILVIGVLSAIAIPSFLNQTSKAYDAAAKELARTAETTAESLGTDNGGSYASLSPLNLSKIEPSIPSSAAGANAWLAAATGDSNSYYVVSEAYSTRDWFEVEHVDGSVYRFCGGPSDSWPTDMTHTSYTISGQVGGCYGGTW